MGLRCDPRKLDVKGIEGIQASLQVVAELVVLLDIPVAPFEPSHSDRERVLAWEHLEAQRRIEGESVFGMMDALPRSLHGIRRNAGGTSHAEESQGCDEELFHSNRP